MTKNNYTDEQKEEFFELLTRVGPFARRREPLGSTRTPATTGCVTRG